TIIYTSSWRKDSPASPSTSGISPPITGKLAENCTNHMLICPLHPVHLPPPSPAPPPSLSSINN
ncbi:hypothetical protein NHX12_001809, partial [Muraenolepis orangiensis]